MAVTQDEEYTVVAGFYKNGTDKARMVADIIKKGYENENTEACIVMINPGSCKEKEEKQDICPSEYNMPDLDCDITYELCIQDPAQKCVIDLMKDCNINRMRIVNLYDLREPKLYKAKQEMQSYNDPANEANLCIFSDVRKKDRDILFEGIQVVFLAWGVDSSLKSYKELAYRKITEIIDETKLIFDQRDGDSKSAYAYRYIKPWLPKHRKVVRENLQTKYGELFV